MKHLSINLKDGMHKKLKIISVVYGKSITGLIEDWINGYDIDLSELDFNAEKDDDLKEVKKTNYKKTKNAEKFKIVEKNVLVTAKKAEMQKKILELRDQKLSFQEIADKLNAEGVPTLSGDGKWDKGAASKLIK